MIAMTDGVEVAIITGIFALLIAIVAGIPAWIGAFHARETHRAVGKSNGNGTVAEMGEKTLGNTTETLGWQATHETTDTHRFGIVDDRMGKIEDALGLDRGPALDGPPT